MKQFICLVFCSLFFAVGASAQKLETFDIVSFKTPQGWQKQASQNAVQLGVDGGAAGGTCLITMFKALPGNSDAKVNFKAAWQTIVKETVNVSGNPQMQPPLSKNGWIGQSGAAPYQAGGKRGFVVLVTLSGQNKMVNVLILTDTDKFEKAIDGFVDSIVLPQIKKAAVVPPKTAPPKTAPPKIQPTAPKSAFQFTTNNFDDGWISTEQANWVAVTKGNAKVLIHYPNKAADQYNSVLLNGLKNAWNVLVAPRYSSATNMQFRPIQSWQSVEFAEASMVEKGTGKTVYVVLFKMDYSNGSGKYLEFIMPNKSAFDAQFGAYHNTEFGWEKLGKMATYNKFAVAPTDLKGSWTNNLSGMTQYVNIYTGADAGATAQTSAQNFVFGAANSYNWDLAVAGGVVGNLKFQTVKSSGKFSVPNNWQVKFSSIEGKPRTYNASFSAVKGARLLWLDGKPFGKIK